MGDITDVLIDCAAVWEKKSTTRFHYLWKTWHHALLLTNKKSKCLTVTTHKSGPQTTSLKKREAWARQGGLESAAADYSLLSIGLSRSQLLKVFIPPHPTPIPVKQGYHLCFPAVKHIVSVMCEDKYSIVGNVLSSNS